DGLPDGVLILGVVGPGPEASRPRPFEFVGAELPATRMAIRDEEPISVLDGGPLVCADGRALLRSLRPLWSSETGRMRTRRPRPAPVLRSDFAGFRFPPDLIVRAVRWVLG